MTQSNDPEAPPEAEDKSELSDDELESVTGGARVLKPLPTPSPSGPVPIPYPNVGTKE